jgi:hypothetical protein
MRTFNPVSDHSDHTTTWWFIGAALSLAAAGWLFVSSLVFHLPADYAAVRNNQIVAAFTVVITLLSLSRPLRPVRLGNAILGYWLLVSAWWMDGATVPARWNATAMAIALVLLSVPLGVPQRSRLAPR